METLLNQNSIHMIALLQTTVIERGFSVSKNRVQRFFIPVLHIFANNWFAGQWAHNESITNQMIEGTFICWKATEVSNANLQHNVLNQTHNS